MAVPCFLMGPRSRRLRAAAAATPVVQVLVAVLVLAAYIAAAEEAKKDEKSFRGYCDICRDHTMCRFSAAGQRGRCPSGQAMQSRPLSPEEQEEVLTAHNTARWKLATGGERRGSPGPQLSAADMRLMVRITTATASALTPLTLCPLCPVVRRGASGHSPALGRPVPVRPRLLPERRALRGRPEHLPGADDSPPQAPRLERGNQEVVRRSDEAQRSPGPTTLQVLAVHGALHSARLGQHVPRGLRRHGVRGAARTPTMEPPHLRVQLRPRGQRRRPPHVPRGGCVLPLRAQLAMLLWSVRLTASLLSRSLESSPEHQVFACFRTRD